MGGRVAERLLIHTFRSGEWPNWSLHTIFVPKLSRHYCIVCLCDCFTLYDISNHFRSLPGYQKKPRGSQCPQGFLFKVWGKRRQSSSFLLADAANPSYWRVLQTIGGRNKSFLLSGAANYWRTQRTEQAMAPKPPYKLAPSRSRERLHVLSNISRQVDQ